MLRIYNKIKDTIICKNIINNSNKDLYKYSDLYKNNSFSNLLNSYFLFKLCKYDILIDNFQSIFNFGSLIITKKATFYLMEKTIGKQFTAGNNLKTLENYCDFYSKNNYKIMANYMSEFIIEKQSNLFFDDCLNKYLESIRFGNKYNDFSVGIKLSCLTYFDIIKKLNDYQLKIDKILFTLLEKNDKNDFFIEKKTIIKSFEFFMEEKYFIKIFNELENYCNLNNINFEENKVHIPSFRLFFGSFIIDHFSEEENYKIYNKIYSKDEINKILEFVNRINLIGIEAFNSNIFMAIDAEQSYLQATIRNLTEQFQLKYNLKKGNKKEVFLNTYQNYLKETKKFLALEIEKSNYLNIPIYMKLVRGAYLIEENNKKIVETCSSFEETSINYDTNSLSIVKNVKPGSKIVFATHNNDSYDLIINFTNYLSNNKIEEEFYSNLKDSIWNDSNYEFINSKFINSFYLDKSKKQKINSKYLKIINFATLLGLNDLLAYKSLKSGFNTIKYLPYGPKEITLPFLIRRAQETKTLFKYSNSQLILINQEIKRRLNIFK